MSGLDPKTLTNSSIINDKPDPFGPAMGKTAFTLAGSVVVELFSSTPRKSTLVNLLLRFYYVGAVALFQIR